MSTQVFNNQLSLYIPHVFPNFTKEYIAEVFQYMGFGLISHVDLVSKLDKHGKAYNAAYIHFVYWYDSSATRNFQEKILDPNRDAKIVHDDPWFWIVLENTAKKYVPGDRKECINLFDEFKAEYGYEDREEEEDEDENYDYENYDDYDDEEYSDYDDDDDHEEYNEDEEEKDEYPRVDVPPVKRVPSYKESHFYLTQQMIEINSSHAYTKQMLAETQDQLEETNTELDIAQQEIVRIEIDLQEEKNMLELIIGKLFSAKSLEDARDDICGELWGTSYATYLESEYETA
jgi:hypothetical protein